VSGIVIVPYQARWAVEFQRIGAALREALGPLALRIDHIGSTSVPGLSAKDIVDIQVTVAALLPGEPLRDRLSAAGFQGPGDIVEDHRPAGDDRPDAEWQKRFCRAPEGERRTHIHIRVVGAANQRYALLFRDFLRSNRPVAGSYEQIKRELARLHPDDIDAYYAIKDPACDLIMAAAEAWAAATSWQPAPSDV
jgi:GrpB-like predicted nucleotidyltransferase (UPF0157 family)